MPSLDKRLSALSPWQPAKGNVLKVIPIAVCYNVLHIQCFTNTKDAMLPQLHLAIVISQSLETVAKSLVSTVLFESATDCVTWESHKRATVVFFYVLRIFSHSRSVLATKMSVTIKTHNPRWWGAAHVLSTIGHLVMGIVGTVTFHNTTIQAFEDFLSGSTLGSPSIRQMGEASLLQGATAVVSQVSPQRSRAHRSRRGAADHKHKTGLGRVRLQFDILCFSPLGRPQGHVR